MDFLGSFDVGVEVELTEATSVLETTATTQQPQQQHEEQQQQQHEEQQEKRSIDNQGLQQQNALWNNFFSNFLFHFVV